MKVKFLIIVAFATLFSLASKADEGMWLLQLMQQQNSIDMMKKQGLKLSATDIYNPNGVSLKDAVGIFGGGCTGEIISPNGLVLTNHHCGYGAIQAHSSVEHDYLTDGFWAATLADELPNERLSFRFVHRIVDITDLVNEQIKSGVVTEINSLTRPYLNKLAQDELAKSDLNGKPGIVAQAYPFYAGNKFYLIYYKVYTDVRMVAAPPSSIGKFGGETDNWMWPRHTCDFSVFRIYADKNGEPADYSPENVPLSTPKYLKISIKGLNEGDYAMILGFPGSTSRYLTESEVTERMYTTNQARIDMRTVRLDVLREAMAKSDKTRIQYASKFAGSSNYWKNSIGMNQAIADNKVLEAKAEVEKQFKEFAKGKPEYEGVVDKINDIVEKSIPVERQIDYLSEFYSAIEFRTPEEPMKKMKEAGCRLLVCGYESGNQEVLNQIKKGITLEQSRAFAENARKLDIKVFGCFMIGLTGDNLDTIQETYKFAQSVYPDMCFFQQSVPFPGTGFYKWAKENGYLITEDYSKWLNEDGYLNCLVDYPYADHKEIEKLRDDLMSKYYFSFAYIVKTFRANLDWTEFKRVMRGGTQYISFRVKKAIKGSDNLD